jgi:hypothetical protein
MSTYLFGAMSRPRPQFPVLAASFNGAIPQTASTTIYERTFTALVPAEVLALQAFITSVCVQTTTGRDGVSTATITHPTVLVASFLALVALSIGLYFVGLAGTPRWLDAVRCLIPAIAFAGWTAVQSDTAVNVLVPSFAGAPAQVTAVIVAVVLGVAANKLTTTPPKTKVTGYEDLVAEADAAPAAEPERD